MSEKKNEDDYKTRKSKKLLSYKSNKVILEFTPIWFQWLGWILILGTLTLLYERTGNVATGCIVLFSHILFFYFFVKYFYQFDWQSFPFIKSQKIAFIISVLLSGIIGYFVWSLFYSVIETLDKTGM